MARCTKCSYLLVLLPKRSKYKCPKCSSLFPEGEIDNREFRVYNQRQRDIDREALELEIKVQKEEKLERKLERQKQLLEKKKKPELTEEQRKQRKKEYDLTYYYKHRKEKILQKKLWRQKNNKYYKGWKKQQKALALQMLENNEYKKCKPEILTSVSTTYLLNYESIPKPL